jgi:hypothetical protein
MSDDPPETRRKYPLKADTVTAIATTVIAVISLFVSVFQMREARRFDTVSMTPRIEFTRHFETGAEFFGLTINNTGLGPCIVRKLEVLVDDQPFDLSATIGWKDAVKAAGIGNRGMTYHSFEDGDIIRPGVESPLVGAGYEKLTAENRDLLRKAVARMTLHITYESMYGERFDKKTQFEGTF